MGYDLYYSANKIQFRAYNIPNKVLFKNILLHGQTAISKYRELHMNRSAAGVLDEDQINTLGYWLLAKRRLREATEVLEINAEDFPNSANAWDSLGESYMINGDRDLAIKAYKKSLELNLKNTNAVEMI